MNRYFSNRSFFIWITISYLLFIFSLVPTLLDPIRINSDTVTGPLIIHDILQKPASITDWKLPPAPALFSDAIAQYLLFKVTNHYRFSLFLLTVLQASLLFFLLYKIGLKISTKNAYLGLFICSSVFSWIHLGITQNMVWLYAYANNMHMGAVIAGLFLISLQVEEPFKGLRTISKIIFFGLMVSLFFESRLFVITYVMPLFIYLSFKKEWKKLFASVVYLFIPFLFGFLLEKVFSLSYEFQWSQAFSYLTLSRALLTNWDYLKGCFFHPSFYPSVMIFLVILSVQIALYAFKKKILNAQTKRVLLISVMSFALTYLAIAVLGRSLLPYTDFRYLVFPASLWILVSSHILADIISPHRKIKILFLLLLIMTNISFVLKNTDFTKYSISDLMEDKIPHQLIVDCISSAFKNQKNPIYGYTGYWSSKIIRFLSNGKIQTQSKMRNYEDFTFMNNTNWHPKGNDPINFILTDNWMKEQSTVEKLGRPLDKISCPTILVTVGYLIEPVTYQVLVYRRDPL